MAVMKISDRVNCRGEITTIGSLADQGMIDFAERQMYVPHSGHKRTVYWAFLAGTAQGWRIGRTAYLSRTGKRDELQSSMSSRSAGEHEPDR